MAAAGVTLSTLFPPPPPFVDPVPPPPSAVAVSLSRHKDIATQNKAREVVRRFRLDCNPRPGPGGAGGGWGGPDRVSRGAEAAPPPTGVPSSTAAWDDAQGPGRPPFPPRGDSSGMGTPMGTPRGPPPDPSSAYYSGGGGSYLYRASPLGFTPGGEPGQTVRRQPPAEQPTVEKAPPPPPVQAALLPPPPPVMPAAGPRAASPEEGELPATALQHRFDGKRAAHPPPHCRAHPNPLASPP